MQNRPQWERTISTEDAQALRAYALNVPNDEVPDYGVGLLEAIADRAPQHDWLEAALLAGYLPAFGNIALVIRAAHMSTLAAVRAHEQDGALGDAVMETFTSDTCRELVALLERFIVDLEVHNARLQRRDAQLQAQEPAGLSPEAAATCEADVFAAEAREQASRVRLQLVQLGHVRPSGWDQT